MELSPIELVLGLFVVAVALAYVARWIGVAYPILLVLGGLALGLVPGVPTIVLDPSVVFLLLLPPILFGAGYSTPIRDFKANLRPIVLLAVGLVLFTTVVVGVAAQLLIPSWRSTPAPPSRWGRSSRRRTRSRRRPSSGASARPAGSSRSSRARA